MSKPEIAEKIVVKHNGIRYGFTIEVRTGIKSGRVYALVCAMRDPDDLHPRDSSTVVRSKDGFEAFIKAVEGDMKEAIMKSKLLPQSEEDNVPAKKSKSKSKKEDSHDGSEEL
jgi:hypothetical protein